MPRWVYAEARVNGGTSFEREAISFLKRFTKVKVTGLYYFAKEVRRRARIRIAVNRSWAHIDDYRYNKKLADTIEFTVDENKGAVSFDVGGGIPYAGVENLPKGESTTMMGNPTMRFVWYRMGAKPMKINRPGFVTRYGKNFFTGAYEGALDDFDKILERAWVKETNKK